MATSSKSSDIRTEGGSALGLPGDHALKARELELTAGWLGRLFGASKNAPMNIAGLVALVLVLTGVALLYWPASMTAAEFWKIATPIITLILGYLFGRKS